MLIWKKKNASIIECQAQALGRSFNIIVSLQTHFNIVVNPNSSTFTKKKKQATRQANNIQQYPMHKCLRPC